MGCSETVCSAPGLAAALNPGCRSKVAPRSWLRRSWHPAVTDEWALGDSPSGGERQKELEQAALRSYKSHQFHGCTMSNISENRESFHTPLTPGASPSGTPTSELPSTGVGSTHSVEHLSKDITDFPSV